MNTFHYVNNPYSWQQWLIRHSDGAVETEFLPLWTGEPWTGRTALLVDLFPATMRRVGLLERTLMGWPE